MFSSNSRLRATFLFKKHKTRARKLLMASYLSNFTHGVPAKLPVNTPKVSPEGWFRLFFRQPIAGTGGFGALSHKVTKAQFKTSERNPYISQKCFLDGLSTFFPEPSVEQTAKTSTSEKCSTQSSLIRPGILFTSLVQMIPLGDAAATTHSVSAGHPYVLHTSPPIIVRPCSIALVNDSIVT